MSAAQVNNAEVETYKVTIEAWQTPQLPGDTSQYRTSTEIIVVSGEGMHVETQVEGGSYSATMLQGGTQYNRDHPDGAWETSPAGITDSQIPSLKPSDHLRLVNGLVDQALLGEETLNGMQVTKVTGRVDMQAKAQSIWGNSDQQDAAFIEGYREPREQMLAGVEEFVGWMGVDDGLFHAYEYLATFPGVGELLPFQYWYRVEYSEFNEPLELPSVEG